MPALPPPREMERAFGARDASYDGIFWAGVRTTGIFCRPSCSARKPRRENLSFFASPKEALFAGLRPCKRCRPLETDGRPPDWVVELLAAAERQFERRLTAADVRALGVEPARAARWFRRQYGMTFAGYCRARRLGRALEGLRTGKSLDEIALGHGFQSHSGFAAAFRKTMGTSPARARNGDCIKMITIESPLGPLLTAATEEGVCLLEFNDRRMLEAQLDTLQKRLRLPVVPGENRHLRQLRAELEKYFAGSLDAFTVPIVAPGSAFEERVWTELRRIPRGTTISYGELARRVGSPGAARAVGTANGRNRVAILIPCHRVVREGGELGGYGGGLWRKQRLLELETGKDALFPAGALH